MPDPQNTQQPAPATPPQDTSAAQRPPVNSLAAQGFRVPATAINAVRIQEAREARAAARNTVEAKNARAGQVATGTPVGNAVAEQQQDERNLLEKTWDFLTNKEDIKYDTTLLDAQMKTDPFSFDYANRIIVRKYEPGEREAGGAMEYITNIFNGMLTGAASGVQNMWYGAKEAAVASVKNYTDRNLSRVVDSKWTDEMYNGIVEQHKAKKIALDLEGAGPFDSIASFSAAVGEQIPLLAASYLTAGAAAELTAGAAVARGATTAVGAVGGFAQTMAALSMEAAQNGIRPSDALPYISAAATVSGLLEGAGDYIGVSRLFSKEIGSAAREATELSAKEALQKLGRGEIVDLATHYLGEASRMKSLLDTRIGHAITTGFGEGVVEEFPQQYVEDAAKNMYNYFKGTNEDKIGEGLFNTPGIGDPALEALRAREFWSYMSNTIGSSEQLEQGIYAGMFGAIFGTGVGAVMYRGNSPVIEQTTFGYLDSANREDLRRGDGETFRRDAALAKVNAQLLSMMESGEIDEATMDAQSRKIQDMLYVSNLFNNNQMNGKGATTVEMRSQAYNMLQRLRSSQEIINGWQDGSIQNQINAGLTEDPALNSLTQTGVNNQLLMAELGYNKANETAPIIQQLMGELGTTGKFDKAAYGKVLADIQNKTYSDYGLAAPTQGEFENFRPAATFEFNGDNYAISDKMDVAKMDSNGNFSRVGQLEAEQALGEYQYKQNEQRIILDEIGESPLTNQERASMSFIHNNPTLRGRLDQAINAFNKALDEDALKTLSGGQTSSAGSAAPQQLQSRVQELTVNLNQVVEAVIGGTGNIGDLNQFGQFGEQIGQARMKGEFPLFRKQLTTLLKSMQKYAMRPQMFNQLSFADQATIYQVVNDEIMPIAQKQQAINDVLQRNNIDLDRNAARERLEDEKAEIAGQRVEAELKGIEQEQRAIDESLSDIERQTQLLDPSSEGESDSIERLASEIRNRIDSISGSIEAANGRLSSELEESPDTETGIGETDELAANSGTGESAVGTGAGTSELSSTSGDSSAGAVEADPWAGPVTAPDFFMVNPNRNGSWADKRQATFSPDASLYDFQLDPTDRTRAEFSLSNDPIIHSEAAKFPEVFLDPVADVMSQFSGGEPIITIQKGEARLMDGKWIVTRKSVVGNQAYADQVNAEAKQTASERMTQPSKPVPPSKEVAAREAANPDNSQQTSAIDSSFVSEQRAAAAVFEMTPPEASLLGRALAMAIPSKTIIPSSIADYESTYLGAKPGAISAPTFGFVIGNDVYLNPDRLNSETPIHEHGHLWVTWAKQAAPERYAKGIELVKSDKTLMDHVGEAYPELKGDALAEEALAQLIGTKGAAILDSMGGVQYLDELVNPGLIARVSNWMSDLWNGIREAFGFQNTNLGNQAWDDMADMTLEDFTSAVATDLLSGQRISDFTVEQPTVAEHTGILPGETFQFHRDRRIGLSDFREEIDPAKLTGKNPLVIYNMLRSGFDPIIDDLVKINKWGSQTQDLYDNHLMDVARYAAAGAVQARFKPTKEVASLYRKLQLGNPRSEASSDKESGIFKEWKRWYEDNYISDGSGNRIFLEARKEQLDMRDKWANMKSGVLGKTAKFLFDLNNMNLETFAEYNGSKGSAIQTIAVNLKRAGAEDASRISLHDKPIFEKFQKLMDGASVFRRVGNPNDVARIEVNVLDSGRDATIALPAAVLMDLYGNIKSQMSLTGDSSALLDPDNPRKTYRFDQQKRPMATGYYFSDPTRDGSDRVHHIMVTPDQLNIIAGYFESGGKYAEAFQTISDMYNGDERFGWIDKVYQRVVGRKLIRPPYYWPTQQVSEATADANIRGAGMLIDQLGFFNDRQDKPGPTLQGYDAVERAYNHMRKLHNFMANAELVDSLSTWRDNVAMQETRITNDAKERFDWVTNLLNDINYVSSPNYQYSKDGAFFDAITRAATTAAFTFNPLTPMIQTCGYTVALGQDIIEDKYLMAAFPRLIGRVAASYGGYFNMTGNPMESFWAEEAVMQRIRDARDYGAEQILYRLEGDVEVSISGVNLNETASFLEAATKKGLIKFGGKTLKNAQKVKDWINQRGLSPMYRSDRAVFIVFWEAAEMQVKARMGTLTTSDAMTEVARLATELAYKTNSMSFVADKTASQRKNDWVSRVLGIFSAQQQKVTNLTFQRFAQWKENPNGDGNAKRLTASIGIALLANALAVALLRDMRDDAKATFIEAATGRRVESREQAFIKDQAKTRDLIIETIQNTIGGVPGGWNSILKATLSLLDSNKWTTAPAENLGLNVLGEIFEAMGTASDRLLNTPELTASGKKRKEPQLIKRNEGKAILRGVAQLAGLSNFGTGVAFDIIWPKEVKEPKKIGEHLKNY